MRFWTLLSDAVDLLRCLYDTGALINDCCLAEVLQLQPHALPLRPQPLSPHPAYLQLSRSARNQSPGPPKRRSASEAPAAHAR